MNLKSLLYTLKTVNLWKTIYFNFHYFPFGIAKKLPVYVCWRTVLYHMGGRIEINVPISRGMIRLGVHDLGIQDGFYSRTIWQSYGTLIVKGNVNIGRGSKICIGGGAKLVLGHNFRISGDTQIICEKGITFGDRCLLSWDILIMDSDLHHLHNSNDDVINAPKPIVVGNHVWIGCRSTILKGVSIADDVVISANSTVTRSVDNERCIVGGQGKNLDILKKNIMWSI